MAVRKGAKSLKDIDKTILKELNKGKIETANLMEILAVDCSALAKNVGITADICTETSILKKMNFFGDRVKNWKKYKNHSSDTVRGFAVYSLAKSNLSFKEKMQAMKHFANDSHFGVREWAWLAVREELAANLDKTISTFIKWSTDESENIRRFSCEAIRPRGVWCTHISVLKETPELALSILENLKTDESKYVRDSVGNWLNDASKTKPLWVKKVCNDWKKNKDAKTDYIIKKAMRSLK